MSTPLTLKKGMLGSDVTLTWQDWQNWQKKPGVDWDSISMTGGEYSPEEFAKALGTAAPPQPNPTADSGSWANQLFATDMTQLTIELNHFVGIYSNNMLTLCEDVADEAEADAKARTICVQGYVRTLPDGTTEYYPPHQVRRVLRRKKQTATLTSTVPTFSAPGYKGYIYNDFNAPLVKWVT